MDLYRQNGQCCFISTLWQSGSLFGRLGIAWPFTESLAVVSSGVIINNAAQTISGGKWGYIDTNGKVVIPLIYDEAGREGFRNGLASVKLNGKWGVIDKAGNQIVPFEYDSVNSFTEDYAVVVLNSKQGVVDTTTGEVIVPFKYDYIYNFADGMAAVRFNGKWGYIALGDAPTEAPALDSAAEWARAGIQSAYSKGFVPGDLLNNYTDVITRAEFCRMAVKYVEYKMGENIDAILADKGVTRNSNAFTDTNDQNILAAYALGITSGTGSGTFTPNGQFSREQAATMIMNTCKVIGMDPATPVQSDFADIGSASNWAVEGINFVRANSIMSGTGNNNFTPKGTYTRQESIVTFDRIK